MKLSDGVRVIVKGLKLGQVPMGLFRYGLDYLPHSLLQARRKMEDKFRLLLPFLCLPEKVALDERNPAIMALKI
jgi:hypothetical protein